MKKATFTLSLAALLAVSLCGCGGNGQPSEADGRKYFESNLRADDLHGTPHLLNFHKTNGLAAEVNGIKIYSLEYEAEVHYDELPPQPGGFTNRMQPAIPAETKTEKGTVEFHNTEKGWVGPDNKVY